MTFRDTEKTRYDSISGVSGFVSVPETSKPQELQKTLAASYMWCYNKDRFGKGSGPIASARIQFGSYPFVEFTCVGSRGVGVPTPAHDGYRPGASASPKAGCKRKGTAAHDGYVTTPRHRPVEAPIPRGHEGGGHVRTRG
jgi:hypothetical protein